MPRVKRDTLGAFELPGRSVLRVFAQELRATGSGVPAAPAAPFLRRREDRIGRSAGQGVC